jgi:hypothetical protein
MRSCKFFETTTPKPYLEFNAQEVRYDSPNSGDETLVGFLQAGWISTALMYVGLNQPTRVSRNLTGHNDLIAREGKGYWGIHKIQLMLEIQRGATIHPPPCLTAVYDMVQDQNRYLCWGVVIYSRFSRNEVSVSWWKALELAWHWRVSY